MAGPLKATYNAAMSRRQSWGLAAALSLAAAGCTLVPYLLAAGRAGPGTSFAGFLINPQDGFSYLAKMRQGAGGSWGFLLPYAPDPGEPAFLFVYYLALGHLAGLLGLPLLHAYHAARLIATLLMFLAAYGFFERCLPDSTARWSAFAFILIGSGLGWLALPFGLWASDLLIPEAVPWFSALTNAHFPLAAAALLLVLGATIERRAAAGSRALAAAIGSLILALVQPFALLLPPLAAAVWLALEAARNRSRQAIWQSLQAHSGTLSVLAAGLLAGLPMLLYDLWVTRAQPALAAWSAQNQTPSPSLPATLLGFGLPLWLAGLAVWKAPATRTPAARLLVVWFLAGLLLVYLPFSLQRRMLLGLYFPLATLAGLGVAWIGERGRRWSGVLALALALSLPSNLIVAAAGVAATAHADANVTVRAGELDAYRWLAAHASPEALVLAGPSDGNRLPAFANVRVLYGHPFETPGAEQARELVATLYAGGQSIDPRLRALRMEYVLYGPEERALGRAAWLESWSPIYRSGEVALYQVPGR